jgi:glycyl-tRNA synthetase
MSQATAKETPLMEKIVSLCKKRGFIFQSSEPYGGCAGVWDYGPLGAELKRNLRDAWWKAVIRDREDNVGLDAAILMNPAIWKASGHVDTFADLMRECSLTNKRVRADHVEPQSGTVMTYTGAQSPTGWKQERTISALLWKGTHIESFRKQVKLLIASYAGEAAGKAEEIELLGEAKGDEVTNSVDFHPETGGALGPARPFNLMLRTFLGPTASLDDPTYLRPETAQAIFAQFKNVYDTSRVKVPFGIGQIGKAFRNEVTPKNFTFRSREFEQMELEFFIRPDEAVEIICGQVAAWSEGADLSEPQDNWGWQMWHRYWVQERTKFYQSIGLGDVVHYYWQTPDELAHYARACVDILCEFPFGTEELEGIAARGDFDLASHQKASGKNLEVFDEELKNAAAKLTPEQKEAIIQKRLAAEQAKTKGEPMSEADVRAWFERLFKGNYVPHVIEPSAGLDRMALAIIAKAFSESVKTDEKGKSETITVLRFHPRIAPIKCGVFPLLKNKPELVAKAREVYAMLKKQMNCFYDETASIGRRYARQDEAGTPFGVTIDFETLGEKGPELQDTVTVRERDSGEQHRIKISELTGWLLARIS